MSPRLRITAPLLLLLAGCSLIEGVFGEPQDGPDAQTVPPERPELQLDFPTEPEPADEPEPEPEPEPDNDQERVRVLYRGSWTSTRTPAPARLLGVDADEKEAWVVLADRGEAWELERVTLDTGRRLDRWRATLPQAQRRLSPTPPEAFSPISGTREADLARFAQLLRRAGPWSSRPRPPAAEGVAVSDAGDHLAALDATGDTLTLVTPTGGTRRLGRGDAAAFSPDGRLLAWRACARPRGACDARLTVTPVSGGASRTVPDLEDVGPPLWAPGGDTLYAAATFEGRPCLVAVSAGGGAPRALHCPGPRHLDFRLGRGGRAAVVVASDAPLNDNPAEREVTWVATSSAKALARHTATFGEMWTLTPDDALLYASDAGAPSGYRGLHLLDQAGRTGKLEVRSDVPLVGLKATRWVGDDVILLRWTSDSIFELIGVTLEDYALRTLTHYREGHE